MTSEPARWQRARASELIAAGADLVAGHSAHVFHGIEWVGERAALYDLGGALDDYAVDARLRNDLGIAALWHPRSEPEVELVGLELRFCETRSRAERRRTGSPPGSSGRAPARHRGRAGR